MHAGFKHSFLFVQKRHFPPFRTHVTQNNNDLAIAGI